MTKLALNIDDNVLTCPKCKGNNLHHMKIEIYQRRTEDQKTVDLITVAAGCFWQHDDGWAEKLQVREVDDAPGRRDSLRIHFVCETCDPGPSNKLCLQIEQNRGYTEVDWITP